jgi:hypothetical protein
MGALALDRSPRGSSGSDNGSGNGGDHAHWIITAFDARSAPAHQRGRLGSGKPRRNGDPGRGFCHDYPDGCLEPRPQSLARLRAARANSGAVARAVDSTATADDKQLLRQSEPDLHGVNATSAELG